MPDALARHCARIERCNQRGARMLSIIDLLEAGTFTPELAAYALSAIGRGASFMIGALPGGAGKTTVMGALLNFVPPDVELATADGLPVLAEGRAPTPKKCFICHEISPGPYYAYLWGAELRAYFKLPAAGHLLATNLHADNYPQAQAQVCGENGVPEAAFRRMNLIFFLSVTRGPAGIVRRVEEVWESDGQSAHALLFAAGVLRPSRLVTPQQLALAAQTISAVMKSGARTIREVRATVLGQAENQ